MGEFGVPLFKASALITKEETVKLPGTEGIFQKQNWPFLLETKWILFGCDLKIAMVLWYIHHRVFIPSCGLNTYLRLFISYLWGYSKQRSLRAKLPFPSQTLSHDSNLGLHKFPFCLQRPWEISPFYPLHQPILGKQGGWECRLREDCEQWLPWVGRVCRLGSSAFSYSASVSLTQKKTHTHTSCFDRRWTNLCLSPASSALINGSLSLASQFREIYSGQRNLGQRSRSRPDAGSSTQ